MWLTNRNCKVGSVKMLTAFCFVRLRVAGYGWSGVGTYVCVYVCIYEAAFLPLCCTAGGQRGPGGCVETGAATVEGESRKSESASMLLVHRHILTGPVVLSLWTPGHAHAWSRKFFLNLVPSVECTKSVSHFNGETDLTSTLSSHTWQTGKTAGAEKLTYYTIIHCVHA